MHINEKRSPRADEGNFGMRDTRGAMIDRPVEAGTKSRNPKPGGFPMRPFFSTSL